MSGCYGGPVVGILSGGTTCVAKAAVGAVSGVASDVASSVFNSIAKGFGDAATGALSWLWGQLNSATSIDLSSAGVRQDLVATTAIAGVIAVALLLIQVIVSALRQDFGGLGRAVRGIAVAFIGAVAAISITGLLLAAVDQMSNGVIEYAYHTNAEGLGRKLIAASALSSLNPVPLFLFAIILLMATVIVWVALMIRKMLIIVAAVFAPIAFAGATSDLTRGWVRKWIEFTVALVFSKLILVIMWMIGLSILNGAGSTGGASNHLTNLAIGTLLLLLGGLAPWIAIKMVHFTGGHFQEIHSQAGGARAGATAVTSAPQKAAAMHSQATNMQSKMGGGKSGGGGGKSGRGSEQQPQQAVAETAQKNPAAPTGAPAASAAGGVATGVVAAGQAVKGAAEKGGQATEQAASASGAGSSQSSRSSSAPSSPPSASSPSKPPTSQPPNPFAQPVKQS